MLNDSELDNFIKIKSKIKKSLKFNFQQIK